MQQIDNPYLDYLNEHVAVDEVLTSLRGAPQFSDINWAELKASFAANKPPSFTFWRRWLSIKYAWGIPTQEAIELIAKYGPIVEMGAGTGYWASLLSQVGADVVAYDKAPPNGTDPWTTLDDVIKGDGYTNGEWHEDQTPFFDVRRGEPSALRKHRDRNLFLSWPPHNEMFAEQCLEYFRGRYVIYVGEWGKSNCGTVGFFKLLEEAYDCADELPLPQWAGMRDWLSVWRRKRMPGERRPLP